MRVEPTGVQPGSPGRGSLSVRHPGLGYRLPTPAPLWGRRVSVPGWPGHLVVRGGAQAPVSPPPFSLLLRLILQGPLPGQAGGGQGSVQPTRPATPACAADTPRGTLGWTPPWTPEWDGGPYSRVPRDAGGQVQLCLQEVGEPDKLPSLSGPGT